MSHLRNLLEETLKVLVRNDVSEKDVQYVTDDEHHCSWHEFVKVAEKIDYNAGYGSDEINLNLKVVGSSWWLERGEYDGSEWWEFKRLPIKALPSGEVQILNVEWYER